MKTFSTTTALTLALFAFEACSDPGPISEADWDRLAGMRWGEMKAVDRPNAVAPTDLDSDKAATLGRLLFFDTKMSGSGNISCNTCHEASTSGADPRGLTSSMGDDGFMSARNAPTLFNSAYRPQYSWFSETDALEDQIKKPMTGAFHNIEDAAIRNYICDLPSPLPEPLDPNDAHRRAMYVSLFGGCSVDQGESPEKSLEREREVIHNVAMSLAAYVRTMDAGDSAFDRFMGDSYSGIHADELTADQIEGATLFVGRASCDECHNTALFSDGKKKGYALGVGQTERDNDGNPRRYQTPPLRHVSQTGPYMHDGSLNSLWDVVAFYRDGGDHHSDVPLPPELKPLALNDAEVWLLVDFLESLDGQTEHAYCWVNYDNQCCDELAQPTGAENCPQ